MRAPSTMLLALAAACQPVEVHFPGDPAPVVPTDPTVPVDPALARADVDASGVRACPNPGERDRLGPFELRTAPDNLTSQAYLWSGGVLAGDLDGDGSLDLVAPAEERARLYRFEQQGDRVIDTSGRLTDFDLDLGTGGSLADFDGDGDLDVLVLRWERANVLLRNDGGGNFTDVTEQVGLTQVAASTASAWGDYDRDGDLDLFVGSYNALEDHTVTSGSFLYENVDGYFVDRSALLPPELQQAYTRVAGFHDLDGDMYPELYVVNDIGRWQSNVLLHNERGTFVRDPGAGLDLAMSGGGLGVGDLNGDGLPDLLIPQWDEISLMMSSAESGRWIEYSDNWDLVVGEAQQVGWGAELADLDNDGDLDAHVAYGRIEVDLPDWDNPRHQPDALFLQQDGAFVDVAPEWGVDDDGTQRGFVLIDLNEDGWLDLVKRDLDGPDLMYLSRCGHEHFLEVTLRDPETRNVYAVGAQVRLRLADGTVMSRTITAGGTGFGTGGPPEVHFGLGAAEVIDRVEVTWPDGQESWVGFGESADQTLTVTRR